MNIPKVIALIVAAFSLGVVSTTHAGMTRAASDTETISQVTIKMPQAAPFFALLNATRASDSTAMRNAYSRRICNETASSDWSENLKEAQASIERLFGNYKIARFGFVFNGDTHKGKLSISYNGNESHSLNVVKEANQWKIDER